MALVTQRRRRSAGITLATAGLALICSAVLAQAPGGRPQTAPPANPPAAAGNLAAPAQSAADAEAVAARYRVPETNNVEELQAFILGLRKFEPPDTQTYLIHRRQLPRAVRAAAEKIMALEPDKTSNNYQEASTLALVARLELLGELTPAEQRELYLDVSKRVSVTRPPQSDLFLATKLATRMEMTTNAALAAEAYTNFSKIFQASDDPEVAKTGKMFAAAARRMSLLGKPMEVFGQTVDGRPFDWKAYQGKIVLIDYWATWCEPCKREFPNVKRLYRLYHDRGFDVVGINEDDSHADVEAFLKTEELPWVNVFDMNAAGDHPMSDYYGVVGYPTILLVGKDGKVVALDARGEKLQEFLTKMLGPAGDEPPAGDKNARTPAGGKRGS